MLEVSYENLPKKLSLMFMGSVHRNNILILSPNEMHMLQSLFYLTIALHVSGIIITHLQEHKRTVTTASGNRYTVIDSVKFFTVNFLCS
jgi:hypothetical protein